MKIPKRWFAIIAIWSLIACIPSFRIPAMRVLQNGPWPFTALFRAQQLQSDFSLGVQTHKDEPGLWVAAALQEPAFEPPKVIGEEQDDEEEDKENRRLHAVWERLNVLFPGKKQNPSEYGDEERDEHRRRLDMVIEKFPREVWIIAMRLRLSWGYMLGNRVGGELSDPNVIANKAAGKPSPEKKDDKPNYTANEIQQVITLCRRGQKLEPDNAFYDWTLAYFLALSWRDKEAWQALANAARKPRWENHRQAEVQAEVSAKERLTGRQLTWEEKTAIYWGVLMPELARYREFARIISWQCIKAQRKGDHATALLLSGYLAKIASLMRRDCRLQIEGLVAVAIESVAFGGCTYDIRQRTKARSYSLKGNFESFIAYAARHNRRDLAQWAQNDSRPATVFRAGAVAVNTIAGITHRQASIIGIANLLQSLLVFLMPAAFYGWLMCGILFLVRPARRTLALEQAWPPIHQRDIIRGSLACGGLRAIGGALWGVVIIGLTVGGGLLLAGSVTVDEIWTSVVDTLYKPIVFNSPNQSFWEGLSYSVLNFDAEVPRTSNNAGWLVAFLPAIFGVAYCFGRAASLQADNFKASKSRVFAFLMGVLSGKFFTSTEDFHLAAAAAQFGRTALFAAFCASYATLIFFTPEDHSWIPAIIAFLCGGTLIFEWFHRWRRGRNRRATVRYALKLLKESWLGWLALASLLFLLMMLAAAPLRKHADDKMNELIRVGEMKMRS